MSRFRPDGDPNTTTNATNSDTDGDDFEDGFEDADHDGVRDWNETDPTTKDTDGDGIWDSVEDANSNRTVDVDNSTNRYLETDPRCADTDGDGIDDGDEDWDKDGKFEPDNPHRETNPRWQDTDNDSLSDGLEIGGWNISVYFEATGEKKSGFPIVVNSNPWNTDTDDDGLTDGQEFENATHPNCPDTDGDGMTDLYELTGPAPSDPCGVEGTPPNLSDLHVNTEVEWELTWVGVGRAALPVYVRTRNEINVTVTVTDNVGLSWIRFHIEDKGEQKARFAQHTNNSTVTVFFKHDLLSKWVSGYDLNITVSDVNGNEGYLEFHIDSALEAFVQWLIGQVTALAKFVMDLASAAIEWIWNATSKLVESIVNPIVDASNEYIENIINTFHQPGIVNDNDRISSEGREILAEAFFSTFFITLYSVIMAILLTISIIQYFISWLAWLLLAIFIVFFVVISLKLFGISFEREDVDDFDLLSMFSSPSEDEFYSKCTSSVFEDDDQTRFPLSFERQQDLLFLADFIVTIMGIYLILKQKADFKWDKIKKGGAVALAVFLLLLSGLFLWFSNKVNHEENPDEIWTAIALDWISLFMAIVSLITSFYAMGKEKFGSPKFVVVIVAAVVAAFGISYAVYALFIDYNTKDKYWEDGKTSISYIARHWKEYHNGTSE